MVGGIVKEVLLRGDKVWVNARCTTYRDECAIYVVRNSDAERIRVGDSIWWQGRMAMWTPYENTQRPEAELRCGVDFDIQIPRIGYSGVVHPAQRLVERAFAEEAA